MADPHAEQKEQHAALLASTLILLYVDMREDVLSRLAFGMFGRLLRPEWVDRVRLTAVGHMVRTAAEIAHDVAPDFDASRMDAYLEKTADTFATTWGKGIEEILAEIEAETQANVSAALEAPLKAADEDADLLTRRAANLAAKDASEGSGYTAKTWHTSGVGDHRASHVAQNGLTIPIDERFPNGLRYPGAPGPPAEVINCQCYLSFGR